MLWRLWADVGGCYIQVMDEFVAVEELHALGYKDMSNLLVEEDSPILKLSSAKGVLLTVSFVFHALIFEKFHLFSISVFGEPYLALEKLPPVMVICCFGLTWLATFGFHMYFYLFLLLTLYD